MNGGIILFFLFKVSISTPSSVRADTIYGEPGAKLAICADFISSLLAIVDHNYIARPIYLLYSTCGYVNIRLSFQRMEIV